jgi:chorismate binding enzyme
MAPPARSPPAQARKRKPAKTNVPGTGLTCALIWPNSGYTDAEASADEVRIGIGGAIVMDSDPEDEFAETILKSRALLHAYHLVTTRQR